MKKTALIIAIIWMTVTAAFAQELRLVVSDKPLNRVLRGLNVEISFDDKALGRYCVSVRKTFKSPEAAISYLLNDKPFKVERIGRVFVISPVAQADDRADVVVGRRFVVAGQLVDWSTGEPLPYAYVRSERGMVLTNEAGMFSLVSNTAQSVRVEVRYLGFEKLDTLLAAGRHRLELGPLAVSLNEITVTPPPETMLMQSGKTSGEMRVNHAVARDLPGSADNSVFSLLRMLPGVRASGEPSDDLIVWGSNWGESQLIYDGFTIFGMKSFNDQIGSVNPYLAKDIRLRKGGWGAASGNRIGAIAEVTGNEGNFEQPSVKANLSNYTANLFASVPIRKRSALSVAYRQTFYNLYNNTNAGGAGHKHGQNAASDIYIEPEYDFRDLNLKFSGMAFADDHYYVSIYGADDRFKFSVNQRSYEVDAKEKNLQYGAAAGYTRIWNGGGKTKFLFSFSGISSAIDNVLDIDNGKAASPDVFYMNNTVREVSSNVEHCFNLGQHQQMQIGGKWQRYATGFNHTQTRVDNPSLYITNNVLLGKLSVQAGLRADWIVGGTSYIHPRVSVRYALSDELTATASWGLYNQFLTRVPFIYREGSYQMIWSLSDSTYLFSMHSIAGLAFSRNGWLLSSEGYLKKNRNELYVIDGATIARSNTLWGADIYLKKDWRGRTLFASYSLTNTEQPERGAGQEFKLGGIASYKFLHLSTTYVYGTGFPYLSTGGHGHGQSGGHQHFDTYTEPYSRLDVSVTCKLRFKACGFQAGASVLNVFNTNNIKYSYRLSDQNNVPDVYTKATPITPIAFIEFIF